jgi:hypothetical protein
MALFFKFSGNWNGFNFVLYFKRMKIRISEKYFIALTAVCILFALCSSTFADEHIASLDFLEVMVSTEGTTIILNVSSSFTYTEDIENHQIAITFENTRVNLLGQDNTKIPSFSPMFETIEISSNAAQNTAVMKIKLSDPAVKPEISITPSENILAFSFKPLDGIPVVAKAPVTLFESPEIETPPTSAEIEPAIADQIEVVDKTTPEPVVDEIPQPVETNHKNKFNIPAEPDPVVQIPKVNTDEASEEIEADTPKADETQDTQTYETISPEVTNPPVDEIQDTQTVESVPVVEIVQPVSQEPVSKPVEDQSANIDNSEEIQPLPEIDIKDKRKIEPPAKIFPVAELQAIHYSQGRVDRDVITLEFLDNSPEYNYEINDSGWIILTLHNVVTPESILPKDEVNREVMGTLIRSISLKKFSENGMQSLQVILSGTKPIDIEITDFEGMIDIALIASEE